MDDLLDTNEGDFMIDDYDDLELDIQEWMILNSPTLYEYFYEDDSSA